MQNMYRQMRHFVSVINVAVVFTLVLQCGMIFITGRAEAAVYPQLSAGSSHSVALKDDGTVWSWGDNTYGQHGNGTTAQYMMPVQAAGLSGIISVYAAADHTIALKDDGTVWTWGANTSGQLGDGSNLLNATPRRVAGLSGIIAVSGGQFHSVALKDDGSVWTWGGNSYGQLGDGSLSDRSVPVKISGVNSAIAIAAGKSVTLILLQDGTVLACGSNQYGQLGYMAPANSPVPVAVSGLQGITAISAGSDHALALKNDGSVLAWGTNGNGQLGDGSTAQRLAPVQVTSLNGVTAIYAGAGHSLALKSDGTLSSWGLNSFGQLGDRTSVERHAPTAVAGAVAVAAIAAGDRFSLWVKVDGTVWGCGRNGSGQLGNGIKSDGSQNPGPVHVEVPSDVTAIAAGANHSLSLTGNGTVWAWGANTFGQLGSGSSSEAFMPVQVQGGDQVAAVAAGANHSLAVHYDGRVSAWGYNGSGQLGDGTTMNSFVPIPVYGLYGMAAVAAGSDFSLALEQSGTVWSWGGNGSGQLGDGTAADRNMPQMVNSLNGVIAIAAGAKHALALLQDGTVWSWGSNSNGQLGDVTPTDRTMPDRINGLNGVIAIAAGSNFSLAVTGDGRVWSWGANSEGQLGYGTMSNQFFPVPVQINVAIRSVACGAEHSLTLDETGRVWAWGRNSAGQLGDGTVTRRLLPVAVQNMFGVTAIAAGNLHSLFLKNDRTVWASGDNSLGQTGNNPFVAVKAQINLVVPPISGNPLTFTDIDIPYLFTPGSNGAVSFTIVNKPNWADFDTATGTLSGLPGVPDIGRYPNIVISATLKDNRVVSLPVFSITVGPPLIGGEPPVSAVVGTPYTFVPWSINARSFQIFGKPEWAVFDTATGMLSGTPGIADAGVSDPIYISASNEGASTMLTPFSITVTVQNRSVTLSAGTGGRITGPVSVEYNGMAIYGVWADVGYHIVDVVVDGISRGPVLSYVLNNVTEDHAISATFAVDTFSIATYTNSHGSISGPSSITYGGAATYTIIPDAGYHVSEIFVDGVYRGAESSLTLTDIKENHAIVIFFDINIYTVTLNAGGNGSISGPAEVSYGDRPVYLFTPQTGYHVADVTINGVSVGPVVSYIFTNGITANTSITATFTIATFNITTNASGGGSINGPVTVDYGGNATYTITPAAGFHIAQVLIDGTSYGVLNSYTFSNVTRNHSLSVTFAVNTVNVAITAGQGGSINGPTTVPVGDKPVYEIVPSDGYRIRDVMVNGISVGAVARYAFPDGITANAAISATFLANDLFIITMNAGSNGLISGPATIRVGESAKFDIIPAYSYVVQDVRVDGVSVGPLTSYSFSDVQADHTISATFVFSYPMITSVSPFHGEFGVSVESPVTVRFAEPLDASTITAGSLSLSRDVHIVQAAAGGNHTLVLLDNGTVAEWGDITGTPAGLSGVTAVAAGFGHSLALMYDTTVAAWGNNDYDQGSVPAGLTEVTAISAGQYHNVALKADGSVVAWGRNDMGQTDVPAGLAGMKAVAAGYNHTLALRSDGTVVAWGDNSSNQATPPEGLSGVIAISAGHYHSVALKADGTVVAWGASAAGQTAVPAGLGGIVAIAAGGWHTLALRYDGLVMAWGGDGHGTSQALVPPGLMNVTGISAGDVHSVALTTANYTVSGWGDDRFGQCTFPWRAITSLPGTVAWDAATAALTFTPAAALPYGATIFGGLSGALKTESGTAIGDNYSWTFFTVSQYHIAGKVVEGNGQIQCTPVTPVRNERVTCSITPGPGFRLSGLTDNGVDVLSRVAANSYSLAGIGSNHTISAHFTSSGRTITATADSNGTITGPAAVTYGENATFTMVPKNGYQVSRVLVDGTDVGNPSSYTFTNVTENHTISVMFERKWYPVNITGCVNLPSDLVQYGDTPSYRFVSVAGFHITDILVNGQSIGVVTDYTFSSGITAPAAIEVVCAVNMFTITSSAGTYGTITGPATVAYGTDATYVITPATGYHVADVLVDGVSIGALSNHTFRSVTADHAISAIFAPNTFTVTLSAGANGSIIGPTTVSYGDKPTYTIVPKTGYHIASVTVNGTSAGAVSSYTFVEGITAPATVIAIFVIDSFTVTVTPGSNGSLAGPTTVTYGGSAAYVITPAIGFHVTDVIVDGVSKGAVTSFSFTNVTANHSISASFGIDLFPVYKSANMGGSISGPDTIAYGGIGHYIVTANTGYIIESVYIDGVAISIIPGSQFVYDFIGTTQSHSIAASFIPAIYTIIATAGSNGSISGPVSVSYGGSAIYYITPATGYQIADVAVDGVSKGALTSFTFTNVSAAHTITATFVAVAPLSIATRTLENGSVGASYSQTLVASSGKNPYSWSISSGSLPAGLKLSSAGVISGTPTSAGVKTFTVQVKDSSGNKASKTLSITITIPPQPDLTIIVVSGPTAITRGATKYSFTATVNNVGTASSAATNVGFYLSNSSTFSTTTSKSNYLVGSVPVGALVAGGSATVTLTTSVPTSAIAAGSYYIGSYVDNGNKVSESSETNNGKLSTGKIIVK